MTSAYDALRNTLAIEVGEEIDVVEIFGAAKILNFRLIVKGA